MVGALDVDVAIIGAGFAGASTAFHLAQIGGRRIVVLEKEPVWGLHASGRNAAMARQLTEDSLVTEFTRRGTEFLRSNNKLFSTPVFQQTGSILLVDRDEEMDLWSARANAAWLPHEKWTLKKVKSHWPWLDGAEAAGGIFTASDGVMDVHALLTGYIQMAQAKGVGFYCNTPVLGIRNVDERVLVRTSDTEFRARAIVNAAGAWAGSIASMAGVDDVVYQPKLRHLFVSEPLHSNANAPFVWHVGAKQFYFRREGGRLLVSACDSTRVDACDAKPQAGNKEFLAQRLLELAPKMADLRVVRTWACLRTFAPDSRPRIGTVDSKHPWYHVLAGLGGHGATASFALGERAARDIELSLQGRGVVGNLQQKPLGREHVGPKP